MSVLKSYTMYINSAMRDFGSNSDYFGIYLKTPLYLSSKSNYFAVKVLSATIPYCFKQMPVSTISGNYRANGVTTNFSFVIPSGNYSITELLAYFRNKMIFLVNSLGISFNFTYDPVTGKATLSANPSVLTYIYVFTFTYSVAPLFWEAMGFVDTTILTFTCPTINNYATQTFLVSDRHVNVHPINRIYVRSDTLTQRVGNIESIVDHATDSDILANITIETAPNTYILYNNSSSNNVHLTNEIIDRLQFYLSSNKSYELSLDGLDWTLSLLIEEHVPPVFKKEDDESSKNPLSNPQNLEALRAIRQGILDDLAKQREALSQPVEGPAGTVDPIVPSL